MDVDAGSGGGHRPAVKRKKKRQFRKNFKPRLDDADLTEEQVSYFKRVIELERSDSFENPEDKVIFVGNILKETEGREIDYSRVTFISALIERILPSATYDHLARFNALFSADIRRLSVHRVASHVLQKLIQVSAQRVRDTLNGLSDDERKSLTDFVVRSGKFFLNNLEEFAWESHANRVARACLASMTGCESACAATAQHKCHDGAAPQSVPRDDAGEKNGETPPEFVALATEFATRIMAWPQLKDMMRCDLTAGFLQVLLTTTRSIDKKLTQKLVGRLLDECFAPEDLDDAKDDKKTTKKREGDKAPIPRVFDSVASKRLLETAIEVASKKKYTQIYARVFINRMARLAIDSNANLTVQRLMKSCRQKVEFESMYDELKDSLKEIVEVGNTGILWTLAETCQRLETRQNDFVTAVLKSFDCFEPDTRQNSVVECVLRMKPYGGHRADAATEDKIFVNLHGSLIVQAMLRFKKPIKIVNSVLAMETDLLCDVFCDRKGCHVADAFVLSENVGEKSRDRLVKKLKGFYVRLATDKNGSRSFDRLWSKASAANRTAAATELSAKESQVNGVPYGRIIAARIRLGELRHRPREWAATVADGNAPADRRKRLFEGIIGGMRTGHRAKDNGEEEH